MLTARTPSRTSASMNSSDCPPLSRSCIASPTQSAACDQVDWVRYLIAVLIRLFPSTKRTSACFSALPSRRRSLGGDVLCACASPVRYAPNLRPTISSIRFKPTSPSKPQRCGLDHHQRGYESDSRKCHGRTDSRSCLKFVERGQPSHWPNSVDFLLGTTTVVISLWSLIFSAGIRKTLLEPGSLLCDRFILSKGPFNSLERDVIWRNRLGFANKLCSDSIFEPELRREHG
jgi:hypothetical protein